MVKEVAANKGANVKIEVTNVEADAGDIAVAAHLQEPRSERHAKVVIERCMMYLDTDTGRYQWLPNNIRINWREGDKLIGHATGQE